MRKPRAYMIHGFAGAGKTTFAKQLESEIQAVRFTHDEWMHQLYGADPGKDFDILFERVDTLIWQQIARLVELQTEVIIDYGFWSRDSRDEARSRLIELGAEPVLIHVRCPMEQMKSRVKQRSDSVPDDSVYINEAAFAKLFERFEPLQEDEPHHMIDSVTFLLDVGRLLDGCSETNA